MCDGRVADSRMFTAKRPARRRNGSVRLERSMQTSRSGGSAETLVTAVVVKPYGRALVVDRRDDRDAGREARHHVPERLGIDRRRGAAHACGLNDGSTLLRRSASASSTSAFTLEARRLRVGLDELQRLAEPVAGDVEPRRYDMGGEEPGEDVAEPVEREEVVQARARVHGGDALSRREASPGTRPSKSAGSRRAAASGESRSLPGTRARRG